MFSRAVYTTPPTPPFSSLCSKINPLEKGQGGGEKEVRVRLQRQLLLHSQGACCQVQARERERERESWFYIGKKVGDQGRGEESIFRTNFWRFPSSLLSPGLELLTFLCHLFLLDQETKELTPVGVIDASHSSGHFGKCKSK